MEQTTYRDPLGVLHALPSPKTYHVEVMSDDLLALEPYHGMGQQPWLFQDGYAVLIKNPALGLVWLHMTTAAVARVLYP
jgi:hypothetical protein